MEWFSENPWVAWLGVALVLVAIEAASVDFVFLMIAGGAVAGAATAAVGAGFAAQVLVAVVVAVVLVFVVRPPIKRHFMVPAGTGGIGAASLVGRTAWVLQPVTETAGRIKLNGETWSARTRDAGTVCEPGQQVRVISIEGATAIVTGDAVGQKSE
ncbi:NfeD family protein [Pedococcus sp. 5OH_020]|uniref:NfeD family protein n=1 Tax=Pedococcus sp. 5OH_020 TaxID=2989814 RepID=UPI0022E9E5EA|nr:NfeD family protein [Pedococcus sp. 5OH_020]